MFLCNIVHVWKATSVLAVMVGEAQTQLFFILKVDIRVDIITPGL